MATDLASTLGTGPGRRGGSGLRKPAPEEYASIARPAVDLEIVIPTLNEERRLPETLERTVSYLSRRPWSSAVVIVDNGSVDATSGVSDSYAHGPVPVHLIGCAAAGKGRAVRRGIRSGSSRFVGFTDADLATPVETLDEIMPLLERGAACVVGSRHTEGAELAVEQGALRRAGGSMFRALGRTVLPEVDDTQCGFKFFNGEQVRDVARRCFVEGFAFDLELLARMRQAGHEILEVPVVWSDAEGSTFRPMRDGLQTAADTLRLRRELDV